MLCQQRYSVAALYGFAGYNIVLQPSGLSPFAMRCSHPSYVASDTTLFLAPLPFPLAVGGFVSRSDHDHLGELRSVLQQPRPQRRFGRHLRNPGSFFGHSNGRSTDISEHARGSPNQSVGVRGSVCGRSFHRPFHRPRTRPWNSTKNFYTLMHRILYCPIRIFADGSHTEQEDTHVTDSTHPQPLLYP